MDVRNSSKTKLYLLMVPSTSSKDIHICGNCKAQHDDLDLFLQHKNICVRNNNEDLNNEVIINETNVDMNTFASQYNRVDKRCLDGMLTSVQTHSQIDTAHELTNLDPEQKPETNLLTSPNMIYMDNQQADVNMKIKNVDCNYQNYLFSNEYKRTFKNVEEDIATLLANQLSSPERAPPIDEFQTEEELYTDNNANNLQENCEELQYTSHREMYRGKLRKLFKCQTCPYSTVLRKDLVRHNRVHTGEKPFKCDSCEKSFTRNDKLLIHQRVHSGDKRYKCQQCCYACVDSGSLIKHMRVHTGERPFKCQLCSYRSRDSSQLTVHLRSHTGDSPFTCTEDKCKAAFKTMSDLKRHMIMHSGEKPHLCQYCDYKCSWKRNLLKHIQTQHPDGAAKDYVCYLCTSYTVPTIRKLKNHFKQFHPKEWTQNNERSKSNNNNETSKKINRKPEIMKTMKKSHECKICDMSFVCHDSLVTHMKYHNKFTLVNHENNENS